MGCGRYRFAAQHVTVRIRVQQTDRPRRQQICSQEYAGNTRAGLRHSTPDTVS